MAFRRVCVSDLTQQTVNHSFLDVFVQCTNSRLNSSASRDQLHSWRCGIKKTRTDPVDDKGEYVRADVWPCYFLYIVAFPCYTPIWTGLVGVSNEDTACVFISTFSIVIWNVLSSNVDLIIIISIYPPSSLWLRIRSFHPFLLSFFLFLY